MEDVWFSVIKRIRTADVKEQVIPVADLLGDLSSEEEKKRLIMENSSVINRFMGSDKEYGLRPANRYSECIDN